MELGLILGSLIPPFLVGALFTGLIQGLPIDANKNMEAAFFGDIVNIFTVVGGIVFTLMCYLHGLLFTTLKTVGDLRERARNQALKVFWITAAAVVIYVALIGVFTEVYADKGVILLSMYGVAVLLTYYVPFHQE